MKQYEIIKAANHLENCGIDINLDNIFDVLKIQTPNLHFSEAYVKNVLSKRKIIQINLQSKINKINRIKQIANQNKNLTFNEIKNIINRSVNVGNNNLREILKDFGYKFKRVDFEKFSEKRKEMAELTRQGWTMAMIAKKYNITRQAVSLLLKKAARDGCVVVKGVLGTLGNPKNSGTNCVLVKRLKSLPKVYKCNVCDKIIEKNRRTCSKECLAELQYKGGKWSRYESVELVCKGCNKTFTRSNYIHSITSVKKKTNNCYCTVGCYRKNQMKSKKLSAE